MTLKTLLTNTTNNYLTTINKLADKDTNNPLQTPIPNSTINKKNNKSTK
jgi:hypothetical protein